MKAGVVAAAAAGTASAQTPLPMKKVVHYRSGKKPDKTPRFNQAVSYGNLLFIAGKGYHKEGDIKVHTKAVLDDLQAELESAGSSMDKVLQCRVFLNDLKDYDGMNEVFHGRFGEEPPVRTTIAAAGGIPGNSLVEIDVVAYI
jgi:enamine deaminase RidA (YjgF/YER057c/UK114 family)